MYLKAAFIVAACSALALGKDEPGKIRFCKGASMSGECDDVQIPGWNQCGVVPDYNAKGDMGSSWACLDGMSICEMFTDGKCKDQATWGRSNLDKFYPYNEPTKIMRSFKCFKDLKYDVPSYTSFPEQPDSTWTAR